MMTIKKKRHRLLSVLLCCAMFVGLLPTMALAETEITTGNATITAPVGGETPTFTATTDAPDKYTAKVVWWIDESQRETTKEEIYPSDLTDTESKYYNYKFVGGQQYTAVVEFTAVGNNTLSYSNTFTINGNEADWVINKLHRTYTFTATGTGGTELTTYGATVGDISLGTVKTGYSTSGLSKNVVITNTGTGMLYTNGSSVTLTSGSDWLELRINAVPSAISVGAENKSWYVVPKAGLAEGDYTAEIQFKDTDNKVVATGNVTFVVASHNFDTGTWKSDETNHWNPCTDTDCTVRGNEAAHNKNTIKNDKEPTFDADGYTGDKYCSVCDRKMETGKAIAAGKYIRESKATMTPAAITADRCANDLAFASLEPSKYTVALKKVYDLTEDSLNTDSGQYPKDEKFVDGHKYRIIFEFTAVGSNVYNQEDEGYTSTFTLNGSATEMATFTYLSGSTNRMVELTAGAGTVEPATEYDITVLNGTAYDNSTNTEISKATAGTVVKVVADTDAMTAVSSEFAGWFALSGAVTFADATQTTTTFTMPEGNVEIAAAAKPVVTSLTLNKATTTLKVGGEETLIATVVPVIHQDNVQWSSNKPTIATVTDSGKVKAIAVGTATITAKVGDTSATCTVTVEAADTPVEPVTKYAITVESGKAYDTSTGNIITEAAEGTTVKLTANAPESGKTFDKWVVESGGIALANADKAETTFAMPASAVSVKATYTDTSTPHTHVFDKEVATDTYKKTDATCMAKATYYKSCECGEKGTETFEYGEKAAHNPASVWTKDATGHWYACQTVGCTEKVSFAAHTPDRTEATETEPIKCTVCEYIITPAISHTHSYSADWKSNETNHWKECACGDKKDTAAHEFEWKIDSNATATADGSKHEECKVCGYAKAAVAIPATGYTITFDAKGGTTVASVNTDKNGKLASIPATSRSGYTFDGWYDAESGGNKVTTDTVFTSNSTVYAHWTYKSSSGGGGGSSTTYYTLTFNTNGGSNISKVSKAKGTTVNIDEYKPTREGYEFTGWYSDKDLTDKLTSVKLAKDTTVYAGWKAIEKDDTKTDVKDEPKTEELPFTDVDKDDWFAKDVEYVYNKGLMSGTDKDTFSFDLTTTRGMIVTVLYRLENKPAVSDSLPFDDVKPDSYYKDAIIWAAENDIVSGYDNGAFGPNDSITREQMAAILWRYAKHAGYDISVGENTNILSYADASAVSAYAVPAMQWACGEGIISGTSDTTLSPKNDATRAQVAAILHRFCEKLGK